MNEILDLMRTSNLLDNVWSITLFDMAVTMILSFGMGMLIREVYFRVYQGAMRSGSFAVSLVILTMISTSLILAVTSNLVLSLGMVGALSIVRFRTAIKDPLEIAFLFWSIETGIVLATGIFPLAIGVNLVIAAILIVLVVRTPEYPYILALRCKKGALVEVKELLDKNTNYTVKSRKVVSQISDSGSAGSQDMWLDFDIEITLKREVRKSSPYNASEFSSTAFVDEVARIPDVDSAVLVTYNGGYMT